MSQWLNKIKTFAEDAADTTNRAAQRARLETEIQYLERQVRLCKEKFGVAVFDIFTTDKAQVDVEYAAHSNEVEGLQADIKTKRIAIEQLKAGVSETEANVPAPPPPGAQRVAGQWAQYADPTGKLYYRNSTTNVTQWNAPPEFSGTTPPSCSRNAGGYPVGSEPVASGTDMNTSSSNSASGMFASAVTAAAPLLIASALSSTARKPESGVPQPRAQGAHDAAPSHAGNASAAADPGGIASVLTAVAGVAATTGTTQDVAKAAAPHVAKAAQQRYTGDKGIEKLTSDASTIATLGSAIANNPAARALGSAILTGVLNNATAPQNGPKSAPPAKR